MQPLFVFCADLHLEDGAWSTRPAIYGDAYYSFEQIVDYCIAQRLPLILAGDVLERKSNSARPIAKLCAGLSRMEAAGQPVFYIQGNHEYDRHAPWLSVHPWPQHMHAKTIDISGAAVYGLDWLPKGAIQDALQAVPETTDILVGHQVWKDLMGNVGRTECELTDVHHVRTVLVGDFHVTKVIDGVNAQGQSVKMLSPGSTAMQDMGETNEKFFFVIGRSAAGFEFQPVSLKTRGVLSYTVHTVEELDDLCAKTLPEEIQRLIEHAVTNEYSPDIHKPLVRVRFDKRIPDAYLRVVTVVGESAHLFCEALTDKSAGRQAQSRDSTKNDLLSVVEELLSGAPASVNCGVSAAYNLAAALLGAENPAKELEVVYQRHMREEHEDATAETGCEELGSPSPADV